MIKIFDSPKPFMSNKELEEFMTTLQIRGYQPFSVQSLGEGVYRNTLQVKAWKIFCFDYSNISLGEIVVNNEV